MKAFNQEEKFFIEASSDITKSNFKEKILQGFFLEIEQTQRK